MKKFYALALAALTIFGASAFESAQLISANKEKRVAHEFEKVAVKAPAVNRAKKAPAAAPGKPAASAADLVGEYWQSARIVENKALQNVNLGVSEVTAEGNEVTFNGFFYSDTPFKGVFDPETQTITIPMGQVITLEDTNAEGKPVTLHLTVYQIVWPEEEGGPLGAEPVTLRYDAATGSIEYYEVDEEGYYETCFLIANADAEIGYYYAQVYELYFDLFDALMSTVTVDDDGNMSDPNYFPITVEQDNANLAIGNFCNFGASNVVNLTLDPEAKTATSQDQQVKLRVNAGGSAIDATCDIMSMDYDSGEFVDNTVVFESTINEDGSVILSTDVLGWCIVSPEDYAGYGNVKWMPTIELFYNPFDQVEAGVKGVAVSDENAPVEYFNLQGVRVANPENGLFIRRQGNTATKVLVK